MNIHNIQRPIAQIISALVHPLILPTLGIIILLFLPSYITFSIPEQAKRLIVAIMLINTCIAPALSIYFLKKVKLITDIRLNERRERVLPMIIGIAFYLFTFYLLKQSSLPVIISFFVMAATITMLMGLVITYFWKISLHMMSMGGFTTFLIYVSLLFGIPMHGIIILSVLFSGMLGSSRLILNAHNPPQIYSGYIMGVAIMSFLFWYLG